MAQERADEHEAEDLPALTGDLVERVLAATEASDAVLLAELLEPLHGADIADLLEQVTTAERREILRLYGREMDGEILTEIDESIREEVIEQIPADVLAEAVRELDSDDVVDLIEDLEEVQQEAILEALDETDRAAVEQSLTWPENSAGRLMQREVVVAPLHWTVAEAIGFLQREDWLPDQFYHVILVDPAHHPVGYVTLGKILSSKPETALSAITEDSFRTISARQEEGDVAYAFNQYHLISAPVVDDDGRLVGVITIDDAMNVLDEEHEEDILRLAGVGEESSISDSVLETVRQRLPWLVANLFTASLSAIVISQFQATISSLVALAALMPIVASTGGIAGTQSLAVAVRALATRDLTVSNARRVVLREIGAGLVNGLSLALLLGVAGGLIFGHVELGVVLGLAMIVNQLVAALGGVMVPLTLERMGLDPALASGTFVTTLTDVMGFFAFLGLATWVLV
ncbi:magnesium transporter [Rhodobacter capsulatus]|uniref:Magnesium transporter MgtE n=1 Tax=Rhodobacter capsulatus TaxID=1061 RepID=A0A0N8VEG3_RHOCA|nr:magnesium transporter [Rhodobacter capsulatus]KQB11462.1 magnesium transporter [Rhodobacter capsulatus]KQB12315.1 magnesium transporter [Rhodobacter capsulatus]PZX25825.1 magnesium transporter [Rhodobacter capsulatus]QNR64126.1 magnesium transporter [Rhodobacter capsulatus]WER10295.1 magnesium transporter [Rhodobacter capsulatus]